MDDIRCLTVQNPWCWAIAYGGKNIENRSRPVSYRGLLAIHAGLRWSLRGAADRRVIAAAGGVLRDVPTGAIIAVCELTDCHPASGCCPPWGDDTYDGKAVHHLVLENVRALETPIPCTGRLGLWRPPAEVLPLLTGGAS